MWRFRRPPPQSVLNHAVTSGYYTLPVILSFKGIDAQVNKELGDKLKPAAKKAGEDAGKQLDESLGKSVKEGLGQAAKGVGRGIRQRRPRRH